MRAKIFIATAIAASIAFHAKASDAAKRRSISVAAGATVPGLGLVIDADYDPRLDSLCPGYRIVSVALINNSFNIIPLDPKGDVWEVRLAGSSKPKRAIHNLRGEDPAAWSSLPEGVREKIGYPLVLPIGGREVIDLFVPESVDLEKFNGVNITLRSLGGKIEVIAR